MPSGVYKRTKIMNRKMSDTMKARGIRPPSPLGKKLSSEHKIRIGESNKGKQIWWTGKKHSLQSRNKMSLYWKGRKKTKEWTEMMKGKNNPNWHGGLSFEPYTLDWTETLRRSIRERDHYICRVCNQYGNEVHHINYNKQDCNPTNLVTLCESCHSKTNFNRTFWMKYFNHN
jgi:hypothetical protein